MLSGAGMKKSDFFTVFGDIYRFIVYRLKYGKNSLIWLAERQSVHRRTDWRVDQATD